MPPPIGPTKGETNFFLYESAEFRKDGYWEGGLRLGYRSANDRFELAAFGRNITDEERLIGAIDFNNLTGFVNAPRTFGVEAKVSYKVWGEKAGRIRAAGWRHLRIGRRCP
jgi:iron complex outermembrane receptor protein